MYSVQIFTDFDQIANSSTDFYRSLPVSNFPDLCLSGAALIHADGRTELRADLNNWMDAICDYANAPKNPN